MLQNFQFKTINSSYDVTRKEINTFLQPRQLLSYNNEAVGSRYLLKKGVAVAYRVKRRRAEQKMENGV